MIKGLFGKKGLFAISDPGAAKAILAFESKLVDEGEQQITIISDRTHSFYNQFGLEVQVIGEKQIDEFITEYQPHYIFTGTSYTSVFELTCVLIAKKMKVVSYSFVDHWTSFLKRFQFEGETHLPNNVLVIDSRAEGLAQEAGIPSELITVFGNPYYDYLKNWHPEISKSEFLTSIGMTSHSFKIISFLPEPLSNVGGVDKYGIDEYECMSLFFRVLGEQQLTDIMVVIKAHSNQDIEVMEASAQRLSDEYKVDYKFISVDINTLMIYSDVVVGIFSNALVEASVLQKPVIRILNKLKVNDPLEDLDIGTVVKSDSELKSAFNKLL